MRCRLRTAESVSMSGHRLTASLQSPGQEHPLSDGAAKRSVLSSKSIKRSHPPIPQTTIDGNTMGFIPHFSRMQRNAAPRRGSALALALLAVSVMLTPLAGANSDEVARAPSGVMYVTGGVGSEAVDRLKSMEKDFNLKLVVYAGPSGLRTLERTSSSLWTSMRPVAPFSVNVCIEGPLFNGKTAAGERISDRCRRLTVTRRPARLRVLRTNWLRSTSGGHATNTRNDR